MDRRVVFISYASRDAQRDPKLLPRVLAEISAAEHQPLYDEFLRRGDSLGQILQRIRSVDKGLLLWSAQAAASDWVRFELAVLRMRAVQTGMPLLVLGLDSTPRPPGSGMIMVSALNELGDALAASLAKTSSPPPAEADSSTRSLVTLRLPWDAPAPRVLAIARSGGSERAEIELDGRVWPTRPIHQIDDGPTLLALPEDCDVDADLDLGVVVPGGPVPRPLEVRRALEFLSRGLSARTEIRALLWAAFDGSRWHRFVRSIDHTRISLHPPERLGPGFTGLETDTNTRRLLGRGFLAGTIMLVLLWPAFHAMLAGLVSPLQGFALLELYRGLMIGTAALVWTASISTAAISWSTGLTMTWVGGSVVPWALILLTHWMPSTRAAGATAGALSMGVTLGLAAVLHIRDHDTRFHVPRRWATVARETLAMPVALALILLIVRLGHWAHARDGWFILGILPLLIVAGVIGTSMLRAPWPRQRLRGWRLPATSKLLLGTALAVALVAVFFAAPVIYPERRGLFEGAWVGALVGLLGGFILAAGFTAVVRLHSRWLSSVAVTAALLGVSVVILPMFRNWLYQNWILLVMVVSSTSTFWTGAALVQFRQR
ncbi:MAG: hypothetical protein AAGF11_28615 [Myxococcota bacterium]